MISVNIATHKAREQYLQQVVDAILNQRTKADAINIYFNDNCFIPDWLHNEKYASIQAFRAKDVNLGASGKFFFSEMQKTGVYITLDDDLIPDTGYIGYLADAAMTYPDSIVGLHGTTYRKHPIQSYYSDPSKRDYYCYDGKEKTTFVDMLGTGAIAFCATLKNKPVLSDFPAKNATDPYLCKKAKEHKIPLVCLVRAKGFVREIVGSQDSAIWKRVAKDDSHQTGIINSIKNFTRQKTEAINTSKYTDAAIEWNHIKVIASELWRETNIVEFGSGISTNYLSRFTDHLTSFEHDAKYAGPNIEVRPLQKGWYKLLKKDLKTISKADVMLIDGPIGESGERYNFPVDIIPETCKVFVDDCHRPQDKELAERIAKHLHRKVTFIQGTQKIMAVI